jgi:hypothetical protein
MYSIATSSTPKIFTSLVVNQLTKKTKNLTAHRLQLDILRDQNPLIMTPQPEVSYVNLLLSHRKIQSSHIRHKIMIRSHKEPKPPTIQEKLRVLKEISRNLRVQQKTDSLTNNDIHKKSLLHGFSIGVLTSRANVHQSKIMGKSNLLKQHKFSDKRNSITRVEISAPCNLILPQKHSVYSSKHPASSNSVCPTTPFVPTRFSADNGSLSSVRYSIRKNAIMKDEEI